MVLKAYDTHSFYFGHGGRMYGGLPPRVIKDWKKRSDKKRPVQPAQLPLELPLPEQEEAPPHSDTDKGDRGVVIIDLIGGSLDDFCS